MPMAYEFRGATIETDEDGYLTDFTAWHPQLALRIAEAEDIDMNDDHWAVVNFLRRYYEDYAIVPAVRVLTRAISNTLGPDKGNSRFLYKLFPGGPLRQACKIAGMPRPASCT